MGAKELVVSTLGVLYTNEGDVENVNLSNRIPITPLVALAYMLFVLIYFPCIATFAAIKQDPAVGNGPYSQQDTPLDWLGLLHLLYFK